MRNRSAATFLAAVAAVPAMSPAQVKFDGSLGPAGELTGSNISIPASRGQQRGGNLFHSFSEFNVNAGQSVRFAGPTNVQNILARVTGGKISNINGTLGSDIAGANLYLINPTGVVFGKGAQLDLSGSLVVTTADVLKLRDGGKFSAVPASDDLLTTAPVSAFGFLSAAPQGVGVFGDLSVSPIVRTVLTGATGKTLSIVAGPQGYSFATISAPSGRVNLVTVNGAGEVAGDGVDLVAAPAPAAGMARGDSSIVNATLIKADGAAGAPAGAISIIGNNLNVGFIVSIGNVTNGPGESGLVDIDLTGKLAIDLGGNIVSQAFTGSGATGSAIRVTADSVSIVNNNDPAGGPSFSSISTAAGVGDRAGDITINTTLLEIGGPQDANIISGFDGASGTLRINASRGIHLTGANSSINSVSSASRSGNVFIRTGDLLLTDGARIFGRAATGQGGGRVEIVADRTIRLNGNSTIFAAAGTNVDAPGGTSIIARDLELRDLSGITTSASELTANSDGGPIDLNVFSLRMLNSTEISSTTNTPAGRGGVINIEAQRVLLDGANPLPNPISGNLIPPGISATSLSGKAGGRITIHARESFSLFNDADIGAFTSDNGGPGGSIDITAPKIIVSGDNSIITTASLSSEDAGQVTLTADSIEISGVRAGVRSPTQESADSTVFGRGGDVLVNADTLRLFAGGQLSTSSASRGQAGNIRVNVRQATLDAANSPADENTGMIAQALGPGNGGEIEVNATDSLTILNNARITAQTASTADMPGSAGNVIVNTAALRLANGGVIAAQSLPGDPATSLGGQGGDVTITADQATLETDANITASTATIGNAGNVNMAVNSLTLTGGATVSSSSTGSDFVDFFAAGNGGSVTIRGNTLDIRDAGSQIAAQTAAGGAGGAIVLEFDTIHITGAPAAGTVSAGVNAQAAGFGDGGSIRIVARDSVAVGAGGLITAQSLSIEPSAGNAGSIRINAGEVSVSDSASIATRAANADAGDINLDAGRSLTLIDNRPGAIAPTADAALNDTFTGPQITARAARNGGNINIVASDLVFVRRGLITAQTGATGGQIRIDPDLVIIDESLIDGRSSGTPVPVVINSDALLLSNDSLILTDAPSFTVNNDIANQVAAIDAQVADATQRLVESCARRYLTGDLDAPASAQTLSSFIVEGRGGTPQPPGTPLPAISLP